MRFIDKAASALSKALLLITRTMLSNDRCEVAAELCKTIGFAQRLYRGDDDLRIKLVASSLDDADISARICGADFF